MFDFILKSKCPELYFREFYKNYLIDNTVTSIYGLGETGKPEDAEVIEEYLNSSKISIVRATMTAVMRLSPEKHTTVITELLTDNRIEIVKLELF